MREHHQSQQTMKQGKMKQGKKDLAKGLERVAHKWIPVMRKTTRLNLARVAHKWTPVMREKMRLDKDSEHVSKDIKKQHTLSIFAAMIIVGFAGSGPFAQAKESAPTSITKAWQTLQADVFDNKAIKETATWLTIKAPDRAHDAALVPITIKANPKDTEGHVKKLTIIIDNNPAPVAAEIDLSPKLGPLHIETRVRVDQYSHVRAIVETSKGELFMAAKFVKAAGGCSAPAMKDRATKMKMLGKTKLRQFTVAPNQQIKQSQKQQAEIQVMVRHPNYSGLQMNQETGYYIPAHFVSEMTIKADDEQLIHINGAISLSEDPVIRFRFLPERERPIIKLDVKDTEDKHFQNQWQLKPRHPQTGS